MGENLDQETIPGGDGIADGQPDGYVGDGCEGDPGAPDRKFIKPFRCAGDEAGPANGDAANRCPLDEPNDRLDVSLDKRIQEIGELRSRVEKFDGGAK